MSVTTAQHGVSRIQQEVTDLQHGRAAFTYGGPLAVILLLLGAGLGFLGMWKLMDLCFAVGVPCS